MEAEHQYKMKVNKEHLTKKTSDFKFQNIHFFLTSSANMQGMDDLKKFLFDQAQINKLSLPSHWSKMYAKLLDMKSTDKKYLKLEEAYDIFQKEAHANPLRGVSIKIGKWFSSHGSSAPPLRKISGSTTDPKNLELCLEFLHNTGKLLWYKDNDNLKDFVFHNVSAVVEVLQELFHHNLCEHLTYDDTKHGKFIDTKTDV